MKISLYIFDPYPTVGGANSTIQKFIASLDLDKYELTYFSLRPPVYINKKINFITINSNSVFFSFYKIRKIILLNNVSSEKIFFSMQYFVNVSTLFFLKEIRDLKIFIYEINHPVELDFSQNIIEFLKKRIIKLLVKKLYHKADIVAANSQELGKDLSFLINKKVEIILNPCFSKISFFKKKKFNKKIKILNISRFEYQKDHLTLLKGINGSKFKDNIELNLVGYGSKKFEITNFVNKNNINCKIFKNTKNLSYFYSSNDIFVFTSIYEGLPTVMIEAASFCMPIISSKFKSGSKEILGNGKFGYLFKVGDHKRLSQLLNNFVKNPQLFYFKEKKCRKNLRKFLISSNIKKFNLLLDSLFNKTN
jgi:glycosyltransferase involved in cell wall biosynthesis